MNLFEQKIKQALENYQAEFNLADWKELESRLDGMQTPKPFSKGKWAVAATLFILAALFFVLYQSGIFSNQSETTQPKTIPIQQKTILSENNENSLHLPNQTEEKKSVSGVPAPTQGVGISKVLPFGEDLGGAKKVSAQNNSEEDKVKNPLPENQTIPDNQEKQNASLSEVILHCSKNTACAGEEVRFYPEMNSGQVAENILSDANQYRWNFGDGKFSSEKEPMHSYKKAGTYKVKLQLTSSDKKTQGYALKETITVHPPAEAEIKWFVSEESNFTINFEAGGNNNITEWKWNFGEKGNTPLTPLTEGNSSSEQNPAHTYSKKGNYTVSLTVKNSLGCAASCSRNIKVEPEDNLLAPTGFSPNGDGLNDTWIPVALIEGNKNFTLTIFSQSGKMVYQTSDKNRPWDGANAKPGETYIWKVALKESNGEESSHKGLITITE